MRGLRLWDGVGVMGCDYMLKWFDPRVVFKGKECWGTWGGHRFDKGVQIQKFRESDLGIPKLDTFKAARLSACGLSGLVQATLQCSQALSEQGKVI